MAEITLCNYTRSASIAGKDEALKLEIQYSYDTQRAGNTDDPTDTIDSTELIEQLNSLGDEGSWNTLEGYTASCMNRILQAFPRIDGLRVSIERTLDSNGLVQIYRIHYGRYD